MTYQLPTLCSTCTRLDRSVVGFGGTVLIKSCEAFPGGIPYEIGGLGGDHRKPRGDEVDGLTFNGDPDPYWIKYHKLQEG